MQTQLELNLQELDQRPLEVRIAFEHANEFTEKFLVYLPDNLHVFRAFAEEALKVRRSGRTHYSARTIIEVLRHNSSLHEQGGEWKLNDHYTPYLARLFDLVHPGVSLWEKRKVKVQS